MSPTAHDQVRQQQQAGAPATDDFGRYVASTEAEFTTELAREAAPATGMSMDAMAALRAAAFFFITDDQNQDAYNIKALAQTALHALAASQGQPPCAPGRVEDEPSHDMRMNAEERSLRRDLEASSCSATPSPQELASAAEEWLRMRAVIEYSDGTWALKETGKVAPPTAQGYTVHPVSAFVAGLLPAPAAHPRPSSRDEPDTALREALVAALANGFMVCQSGGSKRPRVVIEFEQLRHAQDLHTLLARLVPSEPGNDGRPRS